MGLERNLWKWLKKEIQPLEKAGRLHICRVENPAGPGYPDVEGCLDGLNFHLELKAVDRPKRVGTPIRVKFQPRQLPWLSKRWSVGGSAFVLLRVGKGRDFRHYLIPGGDAHKLTCIVEEEIEKISFIRPDDEGRVIISTATEY